MKKGIEKTTDNMENNHNKGGKLGALKGLMNTKYFGAKHGARHEAAQNKALRKKRGENTMPF